MSIIDEVLSRNTEYARTFSLGGLSSHPARRLAVVCCMDCRIDVEQILGLEPGDAHVLRNAGGAVTEDMLRSLLVSHHLLGVEEFMIINHTRCGMMSFDAEDLRRRLTGLTGTAAISPASFHAFRNLEDHVREQIQKLRSHPWIPNSLPIRGFVYDVTTGTLAEITAS